MNNAMIPVADEVTRECLLTRSRRLSRVLTGIYDEAMRPFGINSPQFTLLVVISRLGPVNRSEIGRQNHQDRSTLTRNLQDLLAAGWIEEPPHEARGRGRPIGLTAAGADLVLRAAPAWRTAQGQARSLLGDTGASAVIALGNGLPPQAA